jgi:hypothetical protein
MPPETRTAMRDALSVNSIIVGAYTDRDGGVCPMLAAHRNGGRTSFAAFARAWDRYTHASDVPRKATEREVRTLAAMLDASIAMQERDGSDLVGAIADHRDLQSRRPAARHGEPKRLARELRRRPETGERDRTSELQRRHGWAWLRPFRRLDEYEQALSEIEEAQTHRPPADRQPA